MSKKVVFIAIAAVSALVVILGLSALAYVVGIYNGNAAIEKKILAVDEQNRNNLSNFTLRVQEMAQVPDMQVAGLKEIVSATMTGRYGDDGSRALLQFITEQNPALDQSIYVKIASSMESGRLDFEREQKQKIDVCREYATLNSTLFRGTVSKFLGFPKIDVDPKSKDEDAPCRILVAGEVKEKFKTGTDAVIKLNRAEK
jgi:hypothetical protein